MKSSDTHRICGRSQRIGFGDLVAEQAPERVADVCHGFVERGVGLRVGRFEELRARLFGIEAPRAGEVVREQPVVVDHARGVGDVVRAAAS